MNDEKPFKYVLLDRGYEQGTEFCEALLSTGEFTSSLLKQFGGSSIKSEAAAFLAKRLVNGIDADNFVREFCKLPRTWLSIGMVPAVTSLKKSGSAIDFLTQLGARTSWHGPFIEGSDAWWVRTQLVPHKVAISQFGEDTTYRPFAVRWNVVARASFRPDTTIISLHWHNFSYQGEDGDPEKREQFPYWKHIPLVLRELPDVIATDMAQVQSPQLQTLVLHKLMNAYEPDADSAWQHLKIRATSQGIALNAKSGLHQPGEYEMEGIRNLTATLATSAAKELVAIPTPEDHGKVERALLRTLVREWGTLGYEFAMKDPALGQVRTYVFFGGHHQLPGPDSFPHCKCYATQGGSTRTHDFLARHL